MDYLEKRNQEVDSKKVFMILGWAIFAMTAGVMFIGPFVTGILAELFPEIVTGEWIMWINVGVSFYCIGMPIFYLMTRGLPNGPKGEKKKMSFKQFITTFIICMAAVYLFNILGTIINLIIGLLVGKGEAIANPLIDAVASTSVMATFIFVGVLSPIIEEVVFRGIMLNKLRGYGDKTAIFFTALTFGLFHGNLSQFFYAFVLGLFFAYIATKTNTIKYTVIIHMAINIIGSVLMPLLLNGLPAEAMDPDMLASSPELMKSALLMIGVALLIIIAVLGIIIAGIVLYVKNIKKVELEESQIELLPGTTRKSLYFNPGMILFYVMCLYMFISVIML